MNSALNAALAYAKQTQGNYETPKLPGLGQEAEGSSFADVLTGTLERVQAQGRAADLGVKNFTEGDTDVLSVVTAINEAEVAMETLVSVRDRMVTAYQEIIRMPI